MFYKFLYVLFLVFIRFNYSKSECDMKKFKESGIVPKIIPEAPEAELKVLYPDKPVTCGEEINITLTKNAPLVNYTAVKVDFYAIIMIDPDAPDPHRPVYRHFLHWFVVNIPGHSVQDGKELKTYMPPTPPPYSASHRYVLLVFHQPSYIFSPTYMDGKQRSRFDVADMVEKMNMKSLVAGNFFYTRL